MTRVWVRNPCLLQDPVQQVTERSQEQLALAAVGELPRADRELVLMKDAEGLSIVEIAEITGMREGTIKSKLHRLRRTVAARLAARGVTLDG